MAEAYQLSPGAATALIALPHEPQDIQLTMQIKEEICPWHRYAVSDGINWVSVIFKYDFLCEWSGHLEPLQIITITRASFHKSLGAVFVDEGTVLQDGGPQQIIGDPEELTLQVDPDRHFPIACLHHSREFAGFSPIRALVTYKSELYEEINHGDPPFFMIHLLDETGEIRAHANAGVAHEFYDRFEEGKVYYIHNIGVAYNNYSPFQNMTHRFKLILTRRTVVEECCKTANLPTLRFNFMPLAQILEAQTRVICDVIGIVARIDPLQYARNRKTGRDLAKLTVTIVDQSGIHVEATLWANRAEEFDAPEGTVVAFRRAKVDNGEEVPSLSVLSTSTIHTEPMIKEADVLRDWYKARAKRFAHCDCISESAAR